METKKRNTNPNLILSNHNRYLQKLLSRDKDIIMQDRHLIAINFLLFQLLVLLILVYNYIFSITKISSRDLIILVVVSCIFNLWTALELVRLNSIEKESSINKVKIEQSQNLVLTLRSKHHDFINHLQVVMGLIQLNQHNQAVNYIKDLSKDLIEIEKLISLKRPEVAALISSKVSGLSYVQSNLEITTNLEGLKTRSDKLISLLGNLLDNAIHELSTKEDKWLTIKIYEDDRWYIFEVINPGTISEDMTEKIFEPGFTTKGDKGTGMGLYIVKNTAKDLGGKVKLFTTKDTVTFVVKLPK